MTSSDHRDRPAALARPLVESDRHGASDRNGDVEGQLVTSASRDIIEAKVRYCRMLDQKDWNALATLMTDDVEFGISDTDNSPSMTFGRSETLSLLRSMVEGSTTTHRVADPQFSFSGDEAEAEWSMTCTTVFDDGTAITGHGRYRERWRTDGTAYKLALLTLCDFHTSP